MWTPAARQQLARDHALYATCLTDAEWALVAPMLPAAPRRIARKSNDGPQVRRLLALAASTRA